MDDAERAVIAAQWVEDARAAWPTIARDPAAFVVEVGARLAGDASADDARAIHAADLWLTGACVAGDPIALALFDQRYLGTIDGVLAPRGFARDQIDEVKQELRRKLLVADGDTPRIGDYSGRADLRTWIFTAAVRAAIDLARRQRELPIDDAQLADVPALADDPELAHLKARYRDQLADAVADAIAALPARERLLLKYHYLDGASIDRIASIHGVHRATAARWLVAAREALADRTHRILIARLGVSPTELRSIARLVESQLDVSIRRLLEPAP